MYAWTDGLPSYTNPLFINPLPPYDIGPLALYDRNVYFYVQINLSSVLSYVLRPGTNFSRKFINRGTNFAGNFPYRWDKTLNLPLYIDFNALY